MSEQRTEAGPLVLVVPNFSEGRRVEVMDAIVAAMASVPGVALLNRQSDPDHNRLVVSLAAPPPAARQAALAGAARAIALIDMDQHRGSHPRMGALDVLPFIPLRGVTMDGCVELAREVGRELADTLSLPVYLYERAALSPDRTHLPDVRRGELEGLRADVAAGRRLPDLGPHRIGRAGATAVGARPPLVAFNVNLSGGDPRAARAVARRVRERSGGLVHVRAIGLAVPERGCVQVSMNLVDPLVTPPYRALEAVRMEAAGFGMRVLDTEVVGLIPEAALDLSAAHYLQLSGFHPGEQVIERLLAGVAGGGTGDDTQPVAAAGIGGGTVAGFLDDLASATATPGGGAAGALAGATGAALIAMVARLTAGRRGYEAVAGRMSEVVPLAERERGELLGLADRDAAAFDAVMAAHRLPRGNDAEKAARRAAVEGALGGASEVPMEVARRCAALLPVARELVETGNRSAVSDALSAAQMLRAAAIIALANVSVNLSSMAAGDRVEALQAESGRVRREVEEGLGRAEAAFAGRLSASA